MLPPSGYGAQGMKDGLSEGIRDNRDDDLGLKEVGMAGEMGMGGKGLGPGVSSTER